MIDFSMLSQAIVLHQQGEPQHANALYASMLNKTQNIHRPYARVVRLLKRKVTLAKQRKLLVRRISLIPLTLQFSFN